MRGPEEWPSRRKADRIRLTGPAANLFICNILRWCLLRSAPVWE